MHPNWDALASVLDSWLFATIQIARGYRLYCCPSISKRYHQVAILLHSNNTQMKYHMEAEESSYWAPPWAPSIWPTIPVTCQYFEEHLSIQVFSPTLSSPSRYLQTGTLKVTCWKTVQRTGTWGCSLKDVPFIDAFVVTRGNHSIQTTDVVIIAQITLDSNGILIYTRTYWISLLCIPFLAVPYAQLLQGRLAATFLINLIC